jgi:Na+-driven multidrug efflux pump
MSPAAAFFCFLSHRSHACVTCLLSVLWNVLVLALTPFLLKFFAVSPEAKALVFLLVLINNVMNGLAYPFAEPLGSGLRAAGDIRFTMVVSVSLTIGARLFFSALFELWLNMGVIGIAFGMGIDLFIRGAFFYVRYRSKKWTQCKLI